MKLTQRMRLLLQMMVMIMKVTLLPSAKILFNTLLMTAARTKMNMKKFT